MHELVDVVLRGADGGGGRGGGLVVPRRDVEVLELGLELVHDGGDLVEVHGLHGALHAADDAGHAARHLAHRDGRLDAGGDGVDAGGEAEEGELFVLLPDGVLGVDFGNVWVVLLDGLEDRRGGLVLAGVEGDANRCFVWERRRKGGRGMEEEDMYADLLELVLLRRLVFARFGRLSV